jgi:1,4-alpha-glucan branching enzyme
VTGYFSMVLHTHMPYVRKNGAWPVGEDWLYQAMSETYLPLLGMLAQLGGEGLRDCLSLTLTPVLAEQLADPYVKDRFASYLETTREHAGGDVQDFTYFSDQARKWLAEAYRDEYARKLAAFTAIDGDILAAMASFEADGLIEMLGCSATHAFLPGLGDWRAVRAQVVLGLESHRRHLGSNPRGFWIPECAYRERLEDLLESEGVEYVLVDPTSLGGRPSTRAYRVADSGLSAIARSESAHRNVWDEAAGYPTDGRYMDSTKYYDGSGLHYWKVTGPGVSIEEKEVYELVPAMARALDHARYFFDDVAAELAGSPAGTEPPLVLASYDTELFGHGWREGVYWLEITLRSLACSETVMPVLPSRYLEMYPAAESVELLETTWGTDRDHSTWLNPRTQWMWEEIGSAQRELYELLDGPFGEGAGRERALKQAAREVLLLESSDWPYMVAKGRAGDYAIERFRAHRQRFGVIARGLREGGSLQVNTTLTEIEEVDNLFGDLDLRVVFGEGGWK